MTELERALTNEAPAPFEERHYPVSHWAKLWGVSEKIVRDWARDEMVPGILRIPNVGRRTRRDYITLRISPSAAERIYAKHLRTVQARRPEVM